MATEKKNRPAESPRQDVVVEDMDAVSDVGGGVGLMKNQHDTAKCVMHDTAKAIIQNMR